MTTAGRTYGDWYLVYSRDDVACCGKGYYWQNGDDTSPLYRTEAQAQAAIRRNPKWKLKGVTP